MFTRFPKIFSGPNFQTLLPTMYTGYQLTRNFTGFSSQFYHNGTCLFTVIRVSKLYTVILYSTSITAVFHYIRSTTERTTAVVLCSNLIFCSPNEKVVCSKFYFS